MGHDQNKSSLLLAFPPTDEVRADLAKEFDLVCPESKPLTVDELVKTAQAKNIDAVILSPMHRLSKADIEVLPKTLKIVATSSVGFDHLDLEAYRQRSVVTTNTPDVLTDATADLAMLLLLSASRRLKEHLQIVADGWGKNLGQAEWLGWDLRGKTLGILGMGRIGQALASRARAFGMKVIYSNRRRLDPQEESGAEYYANFREMLPKCDVLSLHAPGTKETAGIMGAEEFAALPKGVIFVNVARGTLVDEEALFAALDSGHVGAVGLDVCLNEPHPDSRFANYANVILTPHVGSATRETRNAMVHRAAENVRRVLKGEPARDPL